MMGELAAFSEKIKLNLALAFPSNKWNLTET